MTNSGSGTWHTDSVACDYTLIYLLELDIIGNSVGLCWVMKNGPMDISVMITDRVHV